MKKMFAAISLGTALAAGMALTGCGRSASESSQAAASASEAAAEEAEETSAGEENTESNLTELVVRFGDDGTPFILHLEDNSTAAAIAGYVGTTEWRLPIYSYDESDVMEYYDIPSRYEIPDNSGTVAEAHAGDVFYSDPNRIVLYYKDAEINEEYTKVGTFDVTEEFVEEVENNPVLEGWGNQIVIICAEE